MAEVVLSTQRVSPSSIQLQSWKNITCRPDGLGLGLLSTMGLQGRVRVSIGPTCERVNRGGDMARRRPFISPASSTRKAGSDGPSTC